MLTSPAPCPTPVGCLTPEPCSEVLDAQCIIYTGDDIICNEDTIVSSDDAVALALNNIVDYFCKKLPTVLVWQSMTLVNGWIVPDASYPAEYAFSPNNDLLYLRGTIRQPNLLTGSAVFNTDLVTTRDFLTVGWDNQNGIMDAVVSITGNLAFASGANNIFNLSLDSVPVIRL